MDTESAIFLFLKENVCSGYSLEAALSSVNDSFTLSRLIKRPKTFRSARDELHNLRFFMKYTETRFQQCLSLFDWTSNSDTIQMLYTYSW